MALPRKEEVAQIGFIGLTPFIAAAVALWLSPQILPSGVVFHFHQLALIYGAVVVAYLAGSGAGAQLAQKEKTVGSFLPGVLITLVALMAALPSGVFFITLGGAWRHLIILILLIVLLIRDQNAVAAGHLPRWYGALRMRLTFWAGLALLLIVSRLLMWGYY